MNLFDFLYRGATVYVAACQIYAEAERRTNLFAMPQAQQDMRAGGTNYAEVESRANGFAMPRRDSICGPKGRIAQKPGAERILFVKRGVTMLIMLIRKMHLGYAGREWQDGPAARGIVR